MKKKIMLLTIALAGCEDRKCPSDRPDCYGELTQGSETSSGESSTSMSLGTTSEGESSTTDYEPEECCYANDQYRCGEICDMLCCDGFTWYDGECTFPNDDDCGSWDCEWEKACDRCWNENVGTMSYYNLIQQCECDADCIVGCGNDYKPFKSLNDCIDACKDPFAGNEGC